MICPTTQRQRCAADWHDGQKKLVRVALFAILVTGGQGIHDLPLTDNATIVIGVA